MSKVHGRYGYLTSPISALESARLRFDRSERLHCGWRARLATTRQRRQSAELLDPVGCSIQATALAQKEVRQGEAL